MLPARSSGTARGVSELTTCGWDIHFIAAFFHHHRLLFLVLGAAAFVALVVYVLRSNKSEQ